MIIGILAMVNYELRLVNTFQNAYRILETFVMISRILFSEVVHRLHYESNIDNDYRK